MDIVEQALLLNLVNLALQQSTCMWQAAKDRSAPRRRLLSVIHLVAERLKFHGEILQEHLCRQVQALLHIVRWACDASDGFPYSHQAFAVAAGGCLTTCLFLLPPQLLPSATGAKQPCHLDVRPAEPGSSGVTAHPEGLQVVPLRMPLPLWSGNAG